MIPRGTVDWYHWHVKLCSLANRYQWYVVPHSTVHRHYWDVTLHSFADRYQWHVMQWSMVRRYHGDVKLCSVVDGYNWNVMLCSLTDTYYMYLSTKLYSTASQKTVKFSLLIWYTTCHAFWITLVITAVLQGSVSFRRQSWTLSWNTCPTEKLEFQVYNMSNLTGN
jgi:hypothetical protein